MVGESTVVANDFVSHASYEASMRIRNHEMQNRFQ
jgi:hypothetical protein